MKDLAFSKWIGFQRNIFTGNIIESEMVVKHVASMMDNDRKNLNIVVDDIGKKIRVFIIDSSNIIPCSSISLFVERPMTDSESREADERLERLGVTAIKR